MEMATNQWWGSYQKEQCIHHIQCHHPLPFPQEAASRVRCSARTARLRPSPIGPVRSTPTGCSSPSAPCTICPCRSKRWCRLRRSRNARRGTGASATRRWCNLSAPPSCPGSWFRSTLPSSPLQLSLSLSAELRAGVSISLSFLLPQNRRKKERRVLVLF